MARMNYATVFSAAGFAGESWDVSKGHDQSYTSQANDVTVSIAKTFTLAAGTFPAWFVAGKVFYTDSVTNPGPFTVKSISGGNVVTVYEACAAEAGVTMVFDGSADVAIQDVLLKDGSGALTADAPLVLYSTGAFGGARQLDISALEKESALQGGEDLRGRFFMLSIENTDIATNNLTIVATGNVNNAASMVISSMGEYMFYFLGDLGWHAVIMPTPADALATIKRVSFADFKWDEGATKDTIKVLQTGAPGNGEVGPHGLTAASTYSVEVWNMDLAYPEIVDIEVQCDASGNITLKKAAKAKDFNGVVVIIGALD